MASNQPTVVARVDCTVAVKAGHGGSASQAHPGI